MSICFHNEKFTSTEECVLPVTDMLIQRGVGVFESIRTYGGKTFARDMHLERLATSAAHCGMNAGKIIESLPWIIKEGTSHPLAPKGECLVKPFITGGKVNCHGTFPNPDFFVIFEELHKPADTSRQGVELMPNYMERPFPTIKTTSYITGLIPLGGAENAFETLYCPNGEITESMSSNFFLCVGDRILTAPQDRVLSGVTRSIILTIAEENGFKVEERCPLTSELATAREAFITGSIKELLPVVKIGDQVIGGGKPGPVTGELYDLFVKNLERWLDK